MFYSTCASCGDILHATFQGQETHPTCPQTEAEQLVRRFVDAIQRHDGAEADRLEKLVNKIDEPPALGSVALWYASMGWPVHPLRREGAPCDGDDKCRKLGACQCSKKPATKHGLKDATSDPDSIRAWWSNCPDSNIGLATGVMFDVIDIDGPEGTASLAKLGPDTLPDIHGKAATPRGFHLYVLPTGDGNRAGVRPGIDYRGAGGYVCAPPSVVGGKRYSWLLRPSPEILGTKVPA